MPFNFVESLTGLVGSAVSNMLWNSILNADKSTSSTKTPTTQDQYNTKYQQVSSPAVKSSANSFSNSFVGVDAEKLPDFDKLIKQNDIRLGRSFADFEDMITSFNVSRLPNYDVTPMPFVGHIIMSRPSLYVDIGSGSVTGGTASEGSPNPQTNFAAMKSHPKTSAFVNDKYRFAKWGKVKIGQALLLKKIPQSVYWPFLNEIDKEEYIGILRKLLAAKKKSVRAENEFELTNKLVRFALSRGFEMKDIRLCMDVPEENEIAE